MTPKWKPMPTMHDFAHRVVEHLTVQSQLILCVQEDKLMLNIINSVLKLVSF